MSLIPTLNHKAMVYTKQKVTSKKTGTTSYEYAPYKHVFCRIRNTRRRRREGKADTDYTIGTYEIIFRTQSLPDVDETYQFKYRDKVYKVFSVNDFYNGRDYTMVHCEMKVE